ncbi:MAG TPA: sodium/glutamate symporter, partial [Tissierellales bacterium]|nr:sodium/glutamate symporter [Tissierellales bacterium]
MTVHEFFVDFALASLLILAGQLLRSKITFFQRFFIPASMIAGFLGLILGPSVFDILPFSGSISSYAGILIIMIFTIVGVNGFKLGGSESKGEGKRILGFQFYRLVAFFVQFIIPIALTLLVFVRIFPQINDGFGMLLVSGFYGGHGTAVAVGETLVNLGWPDAQDLAVTFATVGILTGV